MQRRTLLKAASAAGVVAAVRPIVACAQAKGWRSFEVSAHLEIAQAKGAFHAWMPLPLSQDTDYFKTLANSWSGNAEKAEIVYDPAYRAAMVSALFRPGEAQPDPADVRKVVLEERPNLTLADDVVGQMRTFLFGNWEGNWLAYNYAHDIKLPGSKGAPVAFLMYPQAENADGRVDSLDPDNFKYRIVSREIVA